jgi:predicted NAD-dependent protein-ADP-ribosyltransferase YbiA (DUF1768 family)
VPLIKSEIAMALERELATYQRELQKLLLDTGKFVVVHDDEIAGVWTSYADATQEGYRRFGLSPFLVKKIQIIEEVHYFTRDIRATCRS